MNKFLFLFFAVMLLSFKEKPSKVNPATLGSYYLSDTSLKPAWVLKADADDSKIDFYQGADAAAIFVVTMKDSLHFKTPHEFSHTANQVTTMWTAKGDFLPNNQMELVVHISDVTTGLKFSFSFDEDKKIIFTRR